MTHEVDILLAAYNGEDFLEEQLESIIMQSFTSWHLLIRDDLSNDNTLSIMHKYKKRYPEKISIIDDLLGDLGPTQSFSYLMSKSTAKYISFCDQDDVWEIDKLLIEYDVIVSVEKELAINTPVMVFSDLMVVDKNIKVIAPSLWGLQKLNPLISQSLYHIMAQNVVTGCTVFMNRFALLKSSPIPTNKVMHDHWIAMVVCKYGVIEFIKQPLVKYRQHGNNELGAIKVNLYYFSFKVWQLLKNYKHYTEKYRMLPFKVSLMRVFYYKALISMKRLLR